MFGARLLDPQLAAENGLKAQKTMRFAPRWGRHKRRFDIPVVYTLSMLTSEARSFAVLACFQFSAVARASALL